MTDVATNVGGGLISDATGGIVDGGTLGGIVDSATNGGDVGQSLLDAGLDALRDNI